MEGESDCVSLRIEIGISHGGKPLVHSRKTKEIRYARYPRWSEYLTFDIKTKNLPKVNHGNRLAFFYFELFFCFSVGPTLLQRPSSKTRREETEAVFDASAQLQHRRFRQMGREHPESLSRHTAAIRLSFHTPTRPAPIVYARRRRRRHVSNSIFILLSEPSRRVQSLRSSGCLS